MDLRKFRILQKLGISWSDLISAALDAAEAAWDETTDALDPDSEGGEKISRAEKLAITRVAGRAFGESLAQTIGAEPDA